MRDGAADGTFFITKSFSRAAGGVFSVVNQKDFGYNKDGPPVSRGVEVKHWPRQGNHSADF